MILQLVALRATGAARRTVLRTVLAFVGRFAPLWGPKMAIFGDFRPKNRYFTDNFTVLRVILYPMAAYRTPDMPAQVLESRWTKFEAITSPTS